MAQYYPPVSFYFKVQFNLSGEGDNDFRFQEVTGLSAEVTTEEVKEGGLNGYSHKLPTMAKYGNLTLKRGMLVDSKVTDWIKEAIENFDFAPTNIDVTLLNEAHEPLAQWQFEGAYPVKYALSDLKAEASELMVETLELAYRRFRRIAV